MREAMLPAARKVLGPDHPTILLFTANLANANEAGGRWADAEPLHRLVLARRRETAKSDRPSLANALVTLGQNLLRQPNWSEAEPILRECLAIREKKFPDDWSRFDALSLLGAAMLGQERFAEAEPTLVQGYDGPESPCRQDPATGPFQLGRSRGANCAALQCTGSAR